MSKQNVRKRKLQSMKTYRVVLEREVRYLAEVDVEAESEEAAERLAAALVDTPRGDYWRETDVVSQTARAKELGS